MQIQESWKDSSERYDEVWDLTVVSPGDFANMLFICMSVVFFVLFFVLLFFCVFLARRGRKMNI